MMTISVRGVGPVTIEQLEARLSAYMNAGAPKPVLEGAPEQQAAMLHQVAARGDTQMKALVALLLAQNPAT
ncbi:hypothetical protein [Sphingomonas sp.]|uniref:hypothetical protein n=1 Tax=Sphingomonas sp. TaxID=28214 RepID=UPI002FD8B40B